MWCLLKVRNKMSDEEQIQKALNTLAPMREVATLAKSQIEADEAAR